MYIRVYRCSFISIVDLWVLIDDRSVVINYTKVMSPKRRRVHSRSPTRKRIRAEENRNEAKAEARNSDDFNAADLCTDVRCALIYLKGFVVSEKFENRIPPIVFQHQLYSILKQRTVVDKQVGDLRQSCEIRLFKYGSEANVFEIVFTDDYKAHVLRESQEHSGVSSVLIKRFLTDFISKYPDISLSKQKFVELGFEEHDIVQLVKAGVLTVRDVGSWWLSIPNNGLFVKSFLIGRKSQLAMIKKAKFSELLQQDLLIRSLPKAAKMCSAYHMHDLIGADLVESISTTSGPLIRLRK